MSLYYLSLATENVLGCEECGQGGSSKHCIKNELYETHELDIWTLT